MIRKIAVWILRMVDVDFKLDGDILTVRIYLGGIQLVEWTVDLLKEPEGVSHGKKART